MGTGLVTSSKRIKTLSTRHALKQLYESGFSFSFFRNARFIRTTYLQSKLLFLLRCGYGCGLRLKSVLFDFFYILNGIKHIPPLKEKKKIIH